MLAVRSMAHIGLLGFPNAGKSTLLRALTRARPYPFTTLKPHIDMVQYDDYEPVAIADLPGLIPGSHNNYGLGIQFLQHVERCRGLIHLLDGADDTSHQYKVLTHELSQYSALTSRRACVVVNKVDLPEGSAGLTRLSRLVYIPAIRISAKTELNLSELLKTVSEMYDSGDGVSYTGIHSQGGGGSSRG